MKFLFDLGLPGTFIAYCYSWILYFMRQNDLGQCDQYLSQDCVAVENPNPFETLIDDCICLLFERLDLSDQLRLSKSCYRFELVFKKYYANKLPHHLTSANFEELKKLTDIEIQQYFRCVGEQIESIEILWRTYNKDFSTAMCIAMKERCINLKRLKLVNRPIGEYTKFLNSSNRQTITEVNMSDNELVDKEIAYLKTITSLEVLRLSNNSVLSGKHIKNMRRVKSLSLNSCRAVTQKNLNAICKALNLRYLDIRCSKKLDVNAIVDDCEELEELKYSAGRESDKFCKNVSKLINLKSLTIYGTGEIDADVFERLLCSLQNHILMLKCVSYICHRPHLRPRVFESLKNLLNLRTVWLDSINLNYLNVSLWNNLTEIEDINLNNSKGVNGDEELLSLVRQCGKLKRLSIYGWKLCVNSLKEIISILKYRTEISPSTISTPQLLLAMESNVRWSLQSYILKNPTYLDAHQLSWVSLNRMRGLNDYSLLSKSVFVQYKLEFGDSCTKLLVIVDR